MKQHPQQSLAALWVILWNDMRICESFLTNECDQTGNPWRRHYLRAFLALVEAVTHNMRQLVLARHNEDKTILSEDELFIIHSQQPDLKDNGKIKKREVFFKTIPLIKFTLKCFSRYVQQEEALAEAFKNNGWRTFREVQKTRNDITHPTNPADLVLDDGFMEKLKEASSWFINTVYGLIKIDFTDPECGEKNVKDVAE